jgi:hypothetical protein
MCDGATMSIVSIPFLSEFKPKILSGQKTMTCRTNKKGNPGDAFMAFGKSYTLSHVFRASMMYVVTDAYEQEGCDSPQELIEIWKRIHPVHGYDPDEIVWAHCWMETP